ncbi:MAG: hypothetical protein KC776_42890, partial [Myxococcales bacterium]|nr:hypothetical protein [Myxococcales bacterium]
LLLLTPRWLHAAATASDAALLGTTWLGAFALAFRARQSRQHRPRWALLAGLWVGVGATRSLAALWLVPLMIAVEVLASPRRCFRGGRLFAPSSALLALGLAPLLVLVSNPGLWKSNVVGLARWALAPLAPTVQPTLVLGATIQRPPVPGGYAALWLVETTPWVLLLLALVGLGSSVVRVVRRRAEPWDVLLLAGFAATLLGPALTPLPLTLFPPRVELALPFVALAAAAGASAALSVAQPKLARPSLGVVLLAVALSSLVRVPVLGSYFSPLLGGAGRVIAARSLPPGDGSELSRMAAAMDAMGLPQITISAEPEVPPNAFSTLRELGRMRAAVVIVPRGRPAQLQLTRGAVPGAVARVEAGGAVLWSLAPSP